MSLKLLKQYIFEVSKANERNFAVPAQPFEPEDLTDSGEVEDSSREKYGVDRDDDDTKILYGQDESCGAGSGAIMGHVAPVEKKKNK